MTNFNRSQIQRTAHDWLAIADEANDKSGNPSLVAAAGVVGGLAFASLTASPLAAVIPIGWCVWEAWKINGRKAKNDEAIAVGCVASILSNELFHQFRQQAGDEAVYDQVSWAEDEGLPLSRDAQDFLAWYRQFKQPQAALPAAEAAGELPAAVGANTRLNAVETTATPVDENTQALEQIFELPDESVEQETQTSATLTVTAEPPATASPYASSPPETANTYDLAEAMAHRIKSTVIVAPPRVGKGILVANAGRRLQELRKDVEIWLIDPKDETTEAHYWSFIDSDKRLHFDLRGFAPDKARIEGLLEEFLQRWDASTAAAKLLIVDEFVSLNANLGSDIMRSLKNHLISISSSGAVDANGQRGRFAWIVTQSPNVADIGFGSRNNRDSFAQVLLFSKNSTAILRNAANTHFCPELPDAQRHRLLAPTGRACYYSQGDRWEALPEYCTQFAQGKKSKLSHPFSYQDKDERQDNQPGTEAEAISLEALASLFEEVIGDSKTVDESTTETKSNELPEEAIAIHEYALKQADEWVKVRDIQRANLTPLKGCLAEQVRELFLLLEEKGKGVVEGDEAKMYKPFK